MALNPWETPPFPAKGDATEDVLYLSVGRALSRWEAFEARLFLVFAEFIGAGRNHYRYAAERAYGSVLTFRGRRDMIDAAAEVYFVIRPTMPDATLETNTKTLLTQAARYSARRNEIAHGVVQAYKDADVTQPRTGFVLGPSIYSSNKTRPSYHGMDYPKYLYSSSEIDAFGERFKSLVPMAEKIFRRLRESRQRPA